ncbi:hypothetical protein ONE63_006147 [Megalurothrips usitatus]|uniref:SWI/SNF-related matrix-associated actin-dependent regulator of chromatin subfamily A-like protein 1 n=1 Tax=Megalurothrips usitatus TaxID=439358 RepID=A0AAV7XZW5_9NEOP|nr:hypothetical protein ONE63_006147 [Megalurothrips usitatus]
MSGLTEEQRLRMEENKKKALALRAAKLQASSQASISAKAPNNFYGRGNSGTLTGTSNSHVTPSQAPKTSMATSKLYQKSSQTPPSSYASQDRGKTSNSDFPNVKAGRLELISSDRFELVMDYHQPTIDVIKTLPGRAYDPQKRNWNFPLSDYNNVVSALKALKPAVAIGELPKLVIDTFLKQRITYKTDIDLSPIQTSMRSTLMDFQVEGVKYAVSRGGRVLIADDMGLGKTIQALAIADFYHEEWPLLIVCPSSMRFQWVAEIHKHLKNVNQDKIYVITQRKDNVPDYAEVVIISYDLTNTCKDQLLAKKFGVVIMDESHHLKNPKALRTKCGIEILRACRRCVLLSGTPVLSRPVELHCQLMCIRPKTFNNSKDFAIRYCDAKQNKFGWDFSGSRNMKELSIVLKELLMIRRLKSDVLSQLPPKTREVVILESSGKKLSDTSEFAKILESEGLKGLEKQSTLLSYFQETAAAKTKGVVQYVQDMIENKEKFLIFAHHAKMMDAICSAVEEKRADYIRIDGSVSSDIRKELCNYFQEQENCLVAVLSIKAANTGLTLTAARLVIFAELYWNPGDLIQAEDRAHRIGQADAVLVQYLVQRGTADDKLWPLIQNKLDILHKAGLSQDEFKVDTITAKKRKEEIDIKDYFLDDDDMALAELDLSELENSFENPEKKLRMD